MFDMDRCMSYDNGMPSEMDSSKMVEGNMVGCNTTMPGVVCPPVYECPTENCVHRTIMHEVPQD